MLTIDAADYVAGGYILTRRVARDDAHHSADLLPAWIVSAGPCLADMALEYWWNEANVAEAAGFGVPESSWPELISWYTEQFETSIGAPGIARSPDVIHEFIDRFVTDRTDLTLLGLGLAPEHARELIDNWRSPPDRGEYGVFEMLERGVSLHPGGTALGYEVISYEYGLEHSWLCNSLETLAHERLGITPNEHGLLASASEAAAVADMANDSDAVEPGLWLPWLLVTYSLIPTSP